jgi:ABC-type phosphate transport system substrate-binding protein
MSKPWTTAALATALVAALPLAAAATTASPAARITKTQATKDIQLDGYTNVQDLQQQKNGWTAKAMEGGKQVSLLVNGQGVRKQRP